jgi:hypothetical protein
MATQVFAPGQSASYQIPDRPKDWFSYPLQFTSIVANTPQSQSIQIDAGSDFFLTALTYSAYLAASTSSIQAATRIIPGVTLLLTDSGSNRNLMQSATPLPLIGGDGEWPHRLIHPRLFLRNSNIQVQINAYDASVGTDWDALYLNFEGFRVYYS